MSEKLINSKIIFDRKLAFSRSIGIVTHSELAMLKNKTVAIAGLGGVGGSHVLTMSRLGIGGLHIADMDTFGQENFNRQSGASMKTLGQPKALVMEEMAKSINPEMRIKVFAKGVNKENLTEFFSGIDVYIDGLDFFAFATRKLVFKYCYENNIPAITVGPIGMGAALINFLPGKMSFDDYFQWKETDSELDLAIKFLLGLTPKAPHRHYNVDPESINLQEKRGPSSPMSCDLAAGVAGSEVLKILVHRGRVLSAPHSILFDSYYNRIFHSYLWLGNKNPLQRLKIYAAKKMLAK